MWAPLPVEHYVPWLVSNESWAQRKCFHDISWLSRNSTTLAETNVPEFWRKSSHPSPGLCIMHTRDTWGNTFRRVTWWCMWWLWAKLNLSSKCLDSSSEIIQTLGEVVNKHEARQQAIILRDIVGCIIYKEEMYILFIFLPIYSLKTRRLTKSFLRVGSSNVNHMSHCNSLPLVFPKVEDFQIWTLQETYILGARPNGAEGNLGVLYILLILQKRRKKLREWGGLLVATNKQWLWWGRNTHEL